MSWLVPNFSQHNLCLVVLGRLHVSVTKFQDKFASLWQVNSPYSWNKFQICCTHISCIWQDFYRILRYFSCFCEFRGFTWISRLCDHVKYQKPCIIIIIIIMIIIITKIWWQKVKDGNRNWICKYRFGQYFLVIKYMINLQSQSQTPSG